MIEQISIREAKSEDLEVLKAFEQAVISYERPFAPNLKQSHITYYDIENLITRNDAVLAVATIKEKVIGCGYFLSQNSRPYKTPDKYAYLGFMYVVPEYRGNGINGKIIQYLFQKAKKMNLVEFQLDVYAENEAAIKAYQKIGFEPDLLKMRFNIDE